MTSQTLRIHQATLDDAELIASIGARTFEVSFGADNRPEDMERYLSQSFSKVYIAAQLADPSSIFLLAYKEGKAVGYLMLRASKKSISVTGTKPVELVRLYVEEEIIGKGYVGSKTA